MTIQIRQSSNLSLADGLGGFVSQQLFPAWLPIVTRDEIRCLFIDSIRLVGGFDLIRAEFTITKVGDDFVLSIQYPTESGGWVVLPDIPFTLSVGETYESSTDIEYIKIRRVLNGIDGRMEGRIAQPVNNVLGGADLDISEGDVIRYGVFYLEVEDATYIKDITAYGIIDGVVDTDACQIDLMTSGIYTQRIANATIAPSGLTWTNTETLNTTVSAGIYALWFKTISSGGIGECVYVIEIDQGTGGDQEKMAIVGKHRRYDSTLDGFVLYGAYDGSDIDGDLIGTFPSLPGSVALLLPSSGVRDYLLRVTARNRYGIESQNVLLDHSVSVDAAGDDVTLPQTPTNLALTFLNGGCAKLFFDYVYDMKTPVITAQIEIGSEDDAGISIDFFGRYSSRTIEPVLWGETITARVRFIDSGGKIGEWAEITERAEFDLSTIPKRAIARVGGCSAQGCVPFIGYFSEYKAEDDGSLVFEPGKVSFYYGGELQWHIALDDNDGIVFNLLEWSMNNANVSTPQTEILKSYGGGIYRIGDGTTARIELDCINKKLYATKFKQPLPECHRLESVVTIDDITYFQITPLVENDMYSPESWMAIGSDGTVYHCKIKQGV